VNKKELEWEYKSLKCVVIATDLGHRCGYVNVPKENRFHGFNYGDQVPGAKPNLNRPAGESFTGLINIVCGNKEELEKFTSSLDGIIEIHGGLTYSKSYLNFCEKGWWIGFDCAHCDDGKDLSLIEDPVLRDVFNNPLYRSREGLTIWTLDMVKAETENLAEQVYNQIGNYEKESLDADN
jgi:hypothetical protein